jgi:hypothetical protein
LGGRVFGDMPALMIFDAGFGDGAVIIQPKSGGPCGPSLVSWKRS